LIDAGMFAPQEFLAVLRVLIEQLLHAPDISLLGERGNENCPKLITARLQILQETPKIDGRRQLNYPNCFAGLKTTMLVKVGISLAMGAWHENS
jgi:hypothetical protein